MIRDGKAVPHEAQAAFPLMVKHLLPPGLRGIVVAGLLSALMGSLAGVFNACSTLFTVDLYEKWKPQASQHQIVRMGRIATAVMVLIAMAWIPVDQGRARALRISAGGARLPGAADLRGVLLRRVLEAAQRQGLLLAPWSSASSSACSACWSTRPVTLKLRRDSKTATPHGSFLWIVNNINFQYFSILITLVSAVVMVVVSYADARAGLREDQEPHLRHCHRRRPPPHPRKLGLARGAGLGRRAGGHPRRLPVFPGIEFLPTVFPSLGASARHQTCKRLSFAQRKAGPLAAMRRKTVSGTVTPPSAST